MILTLFLLVIPTLFTMSGKVRSDADINSGLVNAGALPYFFIVHPQRDGLYTGTAPVY